MNTRARTEARARAFLDSPMARLERADLRYLDNFDVHPTDELVCSRCKRTVRPFATERRGFICWNGRTWNPQIHSHECRITTEVGSLSLRCSRCMHGADYSVGIEDCVPAPRGLLQLRWLAETTQLGRDDLARAAVIIYAAGEAVEHRAPRRRAGPHISRRERKRIKRAAAAAWVEAMINYRSPPDDDVPELPLEFLP